LNLLAPVPAKVRSACGVAISLAPSGTRACTEGANSIKVRLGCNLYEKTGETISSLAGAPQLRVSSVFQTEFSTAFAVPVAGL